MVDNNKIVRIQAQKPFETVYELKNEVPSYEEFMKSYESDGKINYDDLGYGDVGSNEGYGPIDKWCSRCSSYKDVPENKRNCPSCGNTFGDLTKTTSGVQKFSSPSVQQHLSNLHDRVERSGGEVYTHIGEREVSITYRKNKDQD